LRRRTSPLEDHLARPPRRRTVSRVRRRGLSIDYTPVYGGGAWTAAESGYEVHTAEAAAYANRKVYRIVQRCDDGCRWISQHPGVPLLN
jgi:hypothetical protein